MVGSIDFKYFFFFFVIILFCDCKNKSTANLSVEQKSIEITKTKSDTIRFTNGFDFPVGKPDAKGYYNAQKFMKNNHLGEDWNGIGGGDSDLGDTIYVIANGYVKFAQNVGGG